MSSAHEHVGPQQLLHEVWHAVFNTHTIVLLTELL